MAQEYTYVKANVTLRGEADTPKFKVGDRVRFQCCICRRVEETRIISRIVHGDTAGFPYTLGTGCHCGFAGKRQTRAKDAELQLIAKVTPRHQFKPGDRVRVTTKHHFHFKKGDEFTVSEVTTHGELVSRTTDGPIYYTLKNYDSPLELVSEAPTSCVSASSMLTADDVQRAARALRQQCLDSWYGAEIYTTKPKEAPMSVVNRIKQLALSKDDRLLQQYGLQCSEGNWTEEAEEVLIQLLLDDNRDRLVAKAKELEAEDKASKK